MHYLIGTAGHPNVGDELITRTWLRLLAERDPDTDVWLDCANPSGAQALLADAHPRLRCVDTLYRLCWEAPSDSPWQVAEFVGSALDEHGLAPRWLPGLGLFGRAATVHVVGGGYINDVWPRHLGLLAALHWAARRGARTGVTGQGFAPLSDGNASLVRHLLADVDVVDVRDEVSARLIDRPSSHSGDDLWLADLDSLVDVERARDFDAVVCVQGDMLEVDIDALIDQCLRHLRHWGVRAGRTAIVECIPRVDRIVFDRLRHLVPELHFVPWIDVLERGFPAGPHQRWFSTRFHPHLVAAWAGARGVAVPVRPGYYDVKHGSLLEAGSGWRLLPAGAPELDDLGRPERSPVGVAATGERVRARKLEIARTLYGWAPSVMAGDTRRAATA